MWGSETTELEVLSDIRVVPDIAKVVKSRKLGFLGSGSYFYIIVCGVSFDMRYDYLPVYRISI